MPRWNYFFIVFQKISTWYSNVFDKSCKNLNFLSVPFHSPIFEIRSVFICFSEECFSIGKLMKMTQNYPSRMYISRDHKSEHQKIYENSHYQKRNVCMIMNLRAQHSELFAIIFNIVPGAPYQAVSTWRQCGINLQKIIILQMENHIRKK